MVWTRIEDYWAEMGLADSLCTPRIPILIVWISCFSFQDYVNKAPHFVGKKDIDVKLTYAYEEPENFQRLFFGWNNSKFPRASKGLSGTLLFLPALLLFWCTARVDDGKVAFKEFCRTSFTFEELTSHPLPKAVDPSFKEVSFRFSYFVN